MVLDAEGHGQSLDLAQNLSDKKNPCSGEEAGASGLPGDRQSAQAHGEPSWPQPVPGLLVI